MNNGSYTEHSISLTGRVRMELTGVSDVESFTENSVIALSSMGNISIDGEELKIESFSTETGRLTVVGKIDAFCYFGRQSKKRRLFDSKNEGK